MLMNVNLWGTCPKYTLLHEPHTAHMLVSRRLEGTSDTVRQDCVLIAQYPDAIQRLQLHLEKAWPKRVWENMPQSNHAPGNYMLQYGACVWSGSLVWADLK